MKRETRIRILNKLAKKDQRLSGKRSRKDIEKHLANSKKNYDKASSELRAVEKMIQNLQQKHDGLKEQSHTAREDMSFCHNLLRNMDFSKATDVRIGRDQDVAYNVDGKWCNYSDEDGVTKYERKKKSEEEDEEKESEDDGDVNDANDINDVFHKLVDLENTDEVTPEELEEGVDVTV